MKTSRYTGSQILGILKQAVMGPVLFFSEICASDSLLLTWKITD
jgi:hypothetical protein